MTTTRVQDTEYINCCGGEEDESKACNDNYNALHARIQEVLALLGSAGEGLFKEDDFLTECMCDEESCTPCVVELIEFLKKITAMLPAPAAPAAPVAPPSPEHVDVVVNPPARAPEQHQAPI